MGEQKITAIVIEEVGSRQQEACVGQRATRKKASP
jgi:hypothetical protein